MSNKRVRAAVLWRWIYNSHPDTDLYKAAREILALRKQIRNKETLSYSGSGKVSVSVSSIINSPKVQRQVTSVREIAASQLASGSKT